MKDLLSYLESKSPDPIGKPTMPVYHVPSRATISRFCPQLPYDESQGNVWVSFRHKRQVVNTTASLITLFTTPFPSRPEITANNGFLFSEDRWILSVMTRFWEAIAPECAQLKYDESTLSSVVCFLDRIRVYLAHTSGINASSAISNRMSTLCSHITATFIIREPLPLPSRVEKSISLLIFDIALIISKSGPRLQSCVEDTLSSLFEVKRNHKRFEGFGQDLQVRTYKCSFLTITDS